MTANPDLESAIAIVGMAARLPGAANVEQFWHNLQNGVESIRQLDDATLLAAGVPSATLFDPSYVKAAAVLDGMEDFDPTFFGLSQKEGRVMDPQHRHFLEVCWEGLEHAGYDPARFEGAIGLFAGSGFNAYLPYNLLTNPQLLEDEGFFLLRHTGNDKDFLATRASYCLDLTGPSVNIQTACSTSLVAVHTAMQSLLSGECDMALAGGVTIELPHGRGYHYQEGEILSPDGHCRSFDRDSKGTVFGSGAGIVVLKRYDDAVASGDSIHALILGSAINNDGSNKVGYLAPSVAGQAQAIAEALLVADVDAASVGYVECHGTGTPVGDPIEVTALTQAYRGSTEQKGYCAIGSVKSNIGHLDTAAGVAGLVKTVQMLKHNKLVPSLNFAEPNPQIDFENSPFYVNTRLQSWPDNGFPRRAGISSLGVGGTNAHVVLQEPPKISPGPPAQRAKQLLLISGRSPKVVEDNSERLATHLDQNRDLSLEDVAHTLQIGRRRFEHRRALVVDNTAQAIQGLRQMDQGSRTQQSLADNPSVVFMFPGGGAQHPNMALDIYRSEAVFRQTVDSCLKILLQQENLDLRPVLFPEAEQLSQAKDQLQQPVYALPALVTIEVALSRLWMSWGVVPEAAIGHSLGEYVAAHISGVMSLETTLGIACCRGRLFASLQPGAMLSVPLSRQELMPLLAGGEQQLSIAAVNGPDLCLASGSEQAVADLEQRLLQQEIESQRLKIAVASHSVMVEPILQELRSYLQTVTLNQPELPYVSNVTGTWVRPEDAVDPEYWVRHLRRSVLFADGISCAMEQPNRVLLEVGPGRTLSALSKLGPLRSGEHMVVSSCRHPKDDVSDLRALLDALGQLWVAGVEPDWKRFYNGVELRRVALPTYAFEHRRLWIEPGAGAVHQQQNEDAALSKRLDPATWLYQRTWLPQPLQQVKVSRAKVLIFQDTLGLWQQLERLLQQRGHTVFTVKLDQSYQQIDNAFTICPQEPQDFQRLLADLPSLPTHIAYLPLIDGQKVIPAGETKTLAFDALLYLAQALANEVLEPIRLLVASDNMQPLPQRRAVAAEKALCLGPVKVIPKELAEVSTLSVDLQRVTAETSQGQLAETLCQELLGTAVGHIAWHGDQRYVESYQSLLSEKQGEQTRLEKRQNSDRVYVLAGGLGGVGLVLARHLCAQGAKVVVTGRSSLPPREQWTRYLQQTGPQDPVRQKLQTLLEIEAAASQTGGLIQVRRADVEQLDSMRQLVQEIQEQQGAVSGLFLIAGVFDDGPLALKSVADCARVIDPKYRGGLVLEKLVEEFKIPRVWLFSSTSAILGLPGQVDYTGANAFLDNLAARLERSTQVTVLNWGMWQQTGMAYRASLPQWPQIKGELTGHPLLQRLQSGTGPKKAFRSVLSARLWPLDEHRLRDGQMVLPGTAIVELARAAWQQQRGDGPLEISELEFVAPLQISGDDAREIEVELDPDAEGYSFVLRAVDSDVAVDGAAANDVVWTELARGKLRPGSHPPDGHLAVEEIKQSCGGKQVVFPPGQQQLAQDKTLQFGSRWKNISAYWLGEQQALGHLKLPENLVDDVQTYALHPGLLDMLSGFAFVLIPGFAESRDLFVPMGYHRISYFAPLSAEIYSHVLYRGQDQGASLFDVEVSDASGKVLCRIDGYRVTGIDPGMLSNGMLSNGQQVEASAPLQQALRTGLTNAEGVLVFDRVEQLAKPTQVVISPVDLHAAIAQAQPEPLPEAAESTSTAVEDQPRDEVEKNLLSLFGSMLGASGIGIEHDFFELGGHSLIAVRLFARIKKSYGISLTIATLFQAPTVKSLAEVVRAKAGLSFQPEAQKTEPSTEQSPGEAVVDAGGWTPLVQIKKGNGSRPFYCVHGAGGNVLNFRDLSVGLDKKRPFYGLQARGVDGQQLPHDSIEEMASDYLKAVQQVQPQGPYLLGGYSGGGVIALEMAAQLRQRGQDVDFLALFDTFRPAIGSRPPPLGSRLRRLAQSGAKAAFGKIRHRVGYGAQQLGDALIVRYLTSRDLELPLELRDNQLMLHFEKAAERYSPKAYDGPVTLFRAEQIDEIYAHAGPRLGWDNLLSNMDVEVVPGDHDSLVLKPNIDILVGKLQKCLQNTDG